MRDRRWKARKGNCISMPILVTVLGHRLGLPVALARAPLHLFAKYQRDDGSWANIEATTGGYKLDASYISELEITDLAIQQGTYLRALTRREAVASMLETLVHHLKERGHYDRVMQVAEMSLRLYPDDFAAYLSARSVYVNQINDLRSRYALVWDLPPYERALFRNWGFAADQLEQRARALGWTPPSAEVEAAYMRTIESVRPQSAQ